MFIGHLAVAFGGKKVEPRLPLPALVAAAFGLDLLWPVFLLAGIEVVRVDPGNTRFTPLDFQSYPWSHSLAMSLVWGALAGLIAFAVLRSTRAAILVAAVVVSHWVLDFVTHRPDLPLWPGGPFEGLGLWNSIPGTVLVEGALFVFGVAAYLQATAPRDAQGRWSLAVLIAIMSAIWISGPFSPAPPSAMAIAVVALMGAAVFPLLAAWVERHRRSV